MFIFFYFFIVLADYKRRDAFLTVASRTLSALHNGCFVGKEGKDDVSQKTRFLSFMEVLHAENQTKSNSIQPPHH